MNTYMQANKNRIVGVREEEFPKESWGIGKETYKKSKSWTETRKNRSLHYCFSAWSAASTSPGKLLEMYILQTDWMKLWGWVPAISFHKSSKWLWCILRFEKHSSTWRFQTIIINIYLYIQLFHVYLKLYQFDRAYRKLPKLLLLRYLCSQLIPPQSIWKLWVPA